MFQTMDPKQLTNNVFSLLEDQWTLISAGDEKKANAMTASWGGLGVLFHKPVATVYIRPQRYTYEFVEERDTFALSFFEEQFKPQLRLMGSKSGRDTDKMAESGLTLAYDEEGTPYFTEAQLVLICRKLYFSDLDPAGFVDPNLEQFYEKKDYHRMYIAEITKAMVK